VNSLLAELPLERLDALAERRLGHAQPVGGPAEMQILRHRDEMAKPAQIEHVIISPANEWPWNYIFHRDFEKL